MPDALSTLLRLPSRNIPNEYRYAKGSLIPSQADLETPFEQERRAEWKRVKDREDARIAGIQDLNEQLTAFNRPDVTTMRGEQQSMALQKLLAPVQMKGEYDLTGRQISAEGQIGAAQAAGQARMGAAEATSRRVASTANTTTQRQLQIQKNADLARRAGALEKQGGGWRGLLSSMGIPISVPNVDEAAQLRSQQSFEPGGDEGDSVDAASFAQDLAQAYPDADESELMAVIQQHGGSEADAAEILALYSALVGR